MDTRLHSAVTMSPTDYLEAFRQVTERMLELTKKKNADYAGADDAFKNFHMVEDIGITSVEAGILTRMTDKFVRIANLIKAEAKVTDEKIEDTCFDLAVYSVILYLYLTEKRKVSSRSKLSSDITEALTDPRLKGALPIYRWPDNTFSSQPPSGRADEILF